MSWRDRSVSGLSFASRSIAAVVETLKHHSADRRPALALVHTGTQTVSYAAPALVVEYFTPDPAVFTASAPVTEYVASALVTEYVHPQP